MPAGHQEVSWAGAGTKWGAAGCLGEEELRPMGTERLIEPLSRRSVFRTSLSMRHGRQDVSTGSPRISSAYCVDVTEQTASISPLACKEFRLMVAGQEDLCIGHIIIFHMPSLDVDLLIPLTSCIYYKGDIYRENPLQSWVFTYLMVFTGYFPYYKIYLAISCSVVCGSHFLNLWLLAPHGSRYHFGT